MAATAGVRVLMGSSMGWLIGLGMLMGVSLGFGPVAVSTLWADAGDAQLPQRNPAVQGGVQRIQAKLRSDDPDKLDPDKYELVEELQQLHERHWRDSLLYSDPRDTTLESATSRNLTRIVVELLRALPRDARHQYRANHDVAAVALYRRALAAHDVDELQRCFELYPLTQAAQQAALTAGDLYLERGLADAAFECWSFVARALELDLLAELCPSDTPGSANTTSPEAPTVTVSGDSIADGSANESLGAITNRPVLQGNAEAPMKPMSLRQFEISIARRGLIESCYDRDPQRFLRHQNRLYELGIPIAELQMQAPTAAENLTADGAWFQGGRALPLPELPFSRARIDWQSVDYGVHRGDGQSVSRYPGLPFNSAGELTHDWVAVVTERDLRRYQVTTGKLTHEQHMFPLPRGNSSFRDTDDSLILRPVTNGNVLVTPYVVRANRKEDYFGYEIANEVPQRGLICVDADDHVLWDTSSRSGDPLLQQLSFNSTPIIHGDRLYALGWREAGYVVAYLVCLDLETGKPHWQTILVCNQVQLTMFGEIANEPFLGELVVEGNRVFACSNLGVCAAVRARDGRIEWVTEYPTIELRAADISRSRAQRRIRWARNPVLSVDSRLIVTPFDSDLLLSFHKGDGRILEKVPSHIIIASRQEIHLLGLQERRLVFAADRDLVRYGSWSLETATPETLRLSQGIQSRPALVRDGVVYTDRTGGLRYRKFESRDEVELYPQERGWLAPGHVTVLPDRILVVNQRHVRSYKEATGEEPRGMITPDSRQPGEQRPGERPPRDRRRRNR